jgi:parvulin-like peptidyl-prolyl isomerase
LPKKPDIKPQREMTKRQLSHWQRESRLQRFTLLGGIILIIAVLAVIGTGVYLDKFRPYQATAVKIDNASYNLDYYTDTLAYMGLVNGNPQYIPYFTSYAAQLIEQDYLYVREAAKQYGINVSDDEVNQEIKKENISSNQAVIDAVRGRLLITKLQDYFDKNVVPATADGKNVQAMFLESQGQVNDVKTRLEKGESFNDIATQLSLEGTSQSKNGDFGWVPPGILSAVVGNSGDTALENKVFSNDIPANTLTQVEDKDLSKGVGYWLVETSDAPVTSSTPAPTPTASPAPQVHLLAMLLGSEQQAEDIKARLAAGGPGNDFASLAKQYSLYSDAANNGGDLGLKAKGEIPALDKVLFPSDASKSLAKNTVSAPIQDTTQSTSGGIWLVKASEPQNQQITGDNRTILVNTQIKNWQDKIWNSNKDSAQNLLTADQTDFAVQQAQSRISK